ncbi:MAG: type II toxin-antitoxin system VapB family antitoxin [Chthoniobacterales bacterium]|nr:type II toxin-antitoxin system VapB family antitoxin [Chthoniobacterales bacterium]
MRTTLNLDDDLLATARACTGIREKTRLLHLGLEALVQREAARHLAETGGKDPNATAGRRRRH